MIADRFTDSNILRKGHTILTGITYPRRPHDVSLHISLLWNYPIDGGGKRIPPRHVPWWGHRNTRVCTQTFLIFPESHHIFSSKIGSNLGPISRCSDKRPYPYLSRNGMPVFVLFAVLEMTFVASPSPFAGELIPGSTINAKALCFREKMNPKLIGLLTNCSLGYVKIMRTSLCPYMRIPLDKVQDFLLVPWLPIIFFRVFTSIIVSHVYNYTLLGMLLQSSHIREYNNIQEGTTRSTHV